MVQVTRHQAVADVGEGHPEAPQVRLGLCRVVADPRPEEIIEVDDDGLPDTKTGLTRVPVGTVATVS